jgi:hypothetical protein
MTDEPAITITKLPRTTSRRMYRAIHRLLRIAARDSREAATQAFSDLMVYGRSAILIEPCDGPKGQKTKATCLGPIHEKGGK